MITNKRQPAPRLSPKLGDKEENKKTQPQQVLIGTKQGKINPDEKQIRQTDIVQG